jgi:ATP-dependent DNA helicase DinG
VTRAGASGFVASVDRVFGDDGPLARSLDEFEPRPGQRAMACAVAEVIDEGGVLLAEAGTGTGKTLAYLVPGIISRRRILVSTGTKTLQEQIFNKDLPELRRALGIPFTSACMKGRGNYLCLHRFEAFRDDPMARAFADPALVETIADWARRTGSGDRAELEALPDEAGFWPDIAATTDNCLGAECPRFQDCFITRMRQRAADSDVVIVNHHLLCADASVRQSAYGEVIPECHVAIIDEAHQLEDVATQYFGVAVSSYRVEDLLHDTERQLATGAIKGDAGDVRHASGRVQDRAALFFMQLANLQHVNGPGEERRRVTSRALGELQEPGESLKSALDALQGAIAVLRDAGEDVLAIGRRAGEIRDDLRFLLRASDPDFVYHVEVRGRGAFLRASPIDVSTIVRELLLDRMQTTVLASATLSVAGSFDYVRRRLGIRGANEIRLQSEFDYAEQALLYLPPRMPDPRSPAFADAAVREIVEILRRSEGRAFVLFTSYSMLRHVERQLADVLDYPLLVQGRAPRSLLLRQFRSLGNAVLLATSSFWQGVDVVGEALSCVVIDKLPFASPGDPITAARIDAINAAGESAFSTYQLPLAILNLQQGLGRLIRHRHDRGVLAVLDPRVRTKGYGARFLEAMPPAPVTSRIEDVARFFAR